MKNIKKETLTLGYNILDTLVFFMQFFVVLFLGLVIILIFPCVSYFTSWHWTIYLTVFSVPYGFLFMAKWLYKVYYWSYQRQSIGKKFERGIL